MEISVRTIYFQKSLLNVFAALVQKHYLYSQSVVQRVEILQALTLKVIKTTMDTFKKKVLFKFFRSFQFLLYNKWGISNKYK